MPEKNQEKDKNTKSKDESKGDNTQASGSSSKSQNSTANDTGRDNNQRDGRKEQKDYFREELRRLDENLKKESSKLKAPERRGYMPYTFNTLEPYTNIESARFLIEYDDSQRDGYVCRQTALGICDPWDDLKMDMDFSTKHDNSSSNKDENREKKKKDKRKRPKEGSTRLPKFPSVKMNTKTLHMDKQLDYSDVPHLREEIRKTCTDTKAEEEYKRTKDDFYRMELDKMDEYHPINRPHMRRTYFAYLQNNPGSRKALHECVQIIDKQEQEKKDTEGRDKPESDERNQQDTDYQISDKKSNEQKEIETQA